MVQSSGNNRTFLISCYWYLTMKFFPKFQRLCLFIMHGTASKHHKTVFRVAHKSLISFPSLPMAVQSGNLASRPFREPFGLHFKDLQSAKASLLHFQNYPWLHNRVASQAARYFRELSSCTSKLPSKPYSQVTQLHGITLIKLCQHITGHTACKVLYCTSSKVMAFHEAAVS